MPGYGTSNQDSILQLNVRGQDAQIWSRLRPELLAWFERLGHEHTVSEALPYAQAKASTVTPQTLAVIPRANSVAMAKLAEDVSRRFLELKRTSASQRQPKPAGTIDIAAASQCLERIKKLLGTRQIMLVATNGEAIVLCASDLCSMAEVLAQFVVSEQV